MGIVPIMGSPPVDTQWRLPEIPCKGGVGEVWHNGEQIAAWHPANRPETGEKAKEMCTLAVQKHKEKHQ